MAIPFEELSLEERMETDFAIKFSNLILRAAVNRNVCELFLEYQTDEKYSRLYSEDDESGEEVNLFPTGEPLVDAFRRTALAETAAVRFKHLAGMDPNEKEVSQAGSFSFAYSETRMRYNPFAPEEANPDPFYRADVLVENTPVETGEQMKLTFTLTQDKYNPIKEAVDKGLI